MTGEADMPDLRAVIREATAAEKRGDRARALRLYEYAAEHYELGNMFLKALAVWKYALSVDPNRLDVRLRLAECFAALRLLEEARAEFRTVIAVASAEGRADLHDRATRGLYALVAS